MNDTMIEAISRLVSAQTREEACEVIASRARERGYENVILCNDETSLHLCDVPQGWHDHYYDQELYQQDLMLRGLKELPMPHYWSDVPRLLCASTEEGQFVDISRDAGLREGISISGSALGQPIIATFSARQSDVDQDGALEEFIALTSVYAFTQARFTPVLDIGLTKAEGDLLPWLSTDRTNEEIADVRCKSANTIKAQIKSIYAKVRKIEPGVRNRQSLIAFCMSRGLIKPQRL